MKHIETVSQPRPNPTRADSLLVKQQEIGVLGDLIALLGDAMGLTQICAQVISSVKDLFPSSSDA
ncbi:MAG: hypothetical protein JXR94_10025 [Candidatus Hydrogenedentes bacterium]|nr:hypothetical protein [Candidatus Hydrogenedentota bacterium]